MKIDRKLTAVFLPTHVNVRRHHCTCKKDESLIEVHSYYVITQSEKSRFGSFEVSELSIATRGQISMRF